MRVNGERFYEKLIQYGKEGLYPLHMPGHKRKGAFFPERFSPYDVDITEMEGFDDLHHAEGVLLEAMEHAAKVYGSKRAYFLINGSTCGILAAISACVKKGDKVILSRNCHKSVYHAIFLLDCEPVYLYPETVSDFDVMGAVSPIELELRLKENPDAKCVVITSPTYEGVVSDTKAITDVAHKRGIPVIVDEAHGAHFGFHEAFPLSAVAHRADIVVHGVHKTLPAFTQSAILHVNGNMVSKDELERYLSIYQSSSPSYLLLYGIDRCMWFLEREGERVFRDYVRRLQKLYQTLTGLKRLTLFHEVEGVSKDCSKIVVSTKGTPLHGKGLFQTLREEHGFQLEMAAPEHVVAMTGLCDEEADLMRFADALFRIDGEMEGKKGRSKEDCTNRENVGGIRLPVRMRPYEAHLREGVLRPIQDCVGGTAKEMVYVYPPGTPLLVPGEEVTEECVACLTRYQQAGFELRGLRDLGGRRMEIVIA